MIGLWSWGELWWSWHVAGFVQVGALCLLALGLERMVTGSAQRAALWRLVSVGALLSLFWPWPLSWEIQVARTADGAVSAAWGGDRTLLCCAAGMVWLGGVLVQVWRLARQRSMLAQLEGITRPFPHAAVQRLGDSWSMALPPLASVHGLSSPVLVGLSRPRILLPAGARLDSSDRILHALLAHELAHHRRRDLHWRLLATCARVLLWTQPLLWLARHRAELAEEMACDREALEQSGISPHAYGSALVDILAAPAAPVAGAGLGAWAPAIRGSGTTHELAQRLRALHPDRRGGARSPWPILLLLPALLPIRVETYVPRIFIHLTYEDGAHIRVTAQPDSDQGLRFLVERAQDAPVVEHRVASLAELGRRDPQAAQALSDCVLRKPGRSWLFGDVSDG